MIKISLTLLFYISLHQKIDLNDSFMGYSIAHSNMLYLIDEKGHFYKEISDLNPQEILRELRIFLNSQ